MINITREAVRDPRNKKRTPPLAEREETQALVRSSNAPERNSNDRDEASDGDSETPETSQPLFCAKCRQTVASEVSFSLTGPGYLLVAFSLMLCGWFACCVFPFVLPNYFVYHHECPNCRSKLSERKPRSPFKIKDEIVTCQAGKCAIVLSKKYLLFLAAFLFLLLSCVVARWCINNFGLPSMPPGDASAVTWDEYVRDCGVRSYLGNPLRADALFRDNYYGKNVVWEGRLHKVREGILARNLLYLDMEPRLYPRTDFPDIAVVFGKDLNSEISKLEVGDRLRCNMTLIDLGVRRRPTLGFLWNVTMIASNDELPPVDYQQGPIAKLRSNLQPVDLQKYAKKMHKQLQNMTPNTDVLVVPMGDPNMPFHNIPIRRYNTNHVDQLGKLKQPEVEMRDAVGTEIGQKSDQPETILQSVKQASA